MHQEYKAPPHSSGDFQSRLLSSLYLLSLSPLSSAFNSCIRCSLWSLLLNPRDIRGSITPGQSLSGGHWVTIPLCYGDVSLEHRKIDHQFKLRHFFLLQLSNGSSTIAHPVAEKQIFFSYLSTCIQICCSNKNVSELATTNYWNKL